MQQIFRCSCLPRAALSFRAGAAAAAAATTGNAVASTSNPILRRHLATVVDASSSSQTSSNSPSTSTSTSPFTTATSTSSSPSGHSTQASSPITSKPKRSLVNASNDFPSRRTPQPVPESEMDRAQTIYLPNIVFRLVRNSPKEAHNPYIATFRVPVQLTKPDIVSYLWQVYGLKATSISTIVEMGDKVLRPGSHVHERRKKNTKKAIVGMEQPFWFPEKRSAAWLDDHFEKRNRQDHIRRRLLPVGDGGPGRGRRSWRWRGSSLTVQGVGSRYSDIMKRIHERRKQQEALVTKLATEEQRSLVKEFEAMKVKVKAEEASS